ncbi:unnamed protein product [Acanthoscelides obtectus]|uniref:Uncharacterized protein n=1 Tax=Acanthoscelides obtectus TaxID=200917 RepID=A0A9P0Q6K2_ACAOB|nr:unnamed protein product [Acanthoscelides obtectus]CAK1675433.1 hypothetical protein AOBTE_LOCUS30219 [Acanthoscelides obtectus]
MSLQTPSSTVPNATLSLGLDDKSEDTTPFGKAVRCYEIVNTNAEGSIQDMHQNRIKSLRKELEYLKETSWKYDPIDKYIGQSCK